LTQYSRYAPLHCTSLSFSPFFHAQRTAIQVENELSEDVEFELYAKECSSTSKVKFPVRSYDTYGASAWENIPDVLHMYGMCSYRDWFEYLEFINPTDKVARKNLGECGAQALELGCEPASFNAYKSLWWDTRRPFAQLGMLTLFETQKFQASVVCLTEQQFKNSKTLKNN
jgi:hypothetical protein